MLTAVRAPADADHSARGAATLCDARMRCHHAMLLTASAALIFILNARAPAAALGMIQVSTRVPASPPFTLPLPPLSAPSPPQVPRPPTADARLGKDGRVCRRLKRSYGVVPGQSWGRLSPAEVDEWKRRRCDRFYCKPSPMEAVGKYICEPL